LKEEIPNEPSKVSSRVVAIGTGNKCIEQTIKTNRGDALMDSHAEVLEY
jgi:hypothetical protein